MDVCKLGCSPTNQHAYDVYVAGVRFVIATNDWAADVQAMKHGDAEWLTRNSVYVQVYKPLWLAPSSMAAQSSGPILPLTAA